MNPRIPPKAAPVGPKPAPAVAPTATPAPAPAPAKKSPPPASAEVENTKDQPAPAAATTTPQLSKNWNDEVVLNSIMRGDHFLHNPINRYNNITHHWRLFCMPDRDFLYEGGVCSTINEFYQRLDSYKQVIIAESGVTGYSISEVNMESVFGDTSVRGSQTTAITMKINEPNGVSFLDALKDSATAAGIYNYLDFYYYLELTFKGYDENGIPVTNPFACLPPNEFGVQQNLPNGGRWIWTVRINEIDVNLGSGGGEYKLTLLPMADAALDQEYANVVDTIITRGDTVGEFFDHLQVSLNDSWNRRLALAPRAEGFVTHNFKFHGIPAHGGPPSLDADGERREAQRQDAQAAKKNGVKITGVIKTDDDRDNQPFTEAAEKRILIEDIFRNGLTAEQIRNMKLRPQNQDYSLIRTQQGFTFVDPSPHPKKADGTPDENAEALPKGEPDTPTANIGRGTPIGNIIETVMGTCEDAQALARDARGDGRTADESQDSMNQKRFRETVTWQIIPEMRLNKTGEWKYDFFTNRYGRNITWHIYPKIDQEPILSHRQIREAYSVNGDNGVQKSTLCALAARGFLPKRYDYLFTGINTEVLNFDLNFNFAWSVMLPRFTNYYHDQAQQNAKVNPLTLADQVDQNYDSERFAWREKASAHDRRAWNADDKVHIDDTEEEQKEHREIIEERDALARLAVERDKTYKAAIEERDRVVASISKADKDRILTGGMEQNYDRVFVERYMAVQRAQDRPVSRIPLVPFSFAAGDESKQDAGLGATGQWHNGRQLYGAVLNQVYGTVTGRFQQIEVEIRGDPFWIGSGCFEAAIQHDNEAQVDRPRQAYHFLGQNCFIFRFKYPTDTDESGSVVLKDNETVTGVYKVINIKNNFAGGKFTQTLSAIRLPLIDLFNSIYGIDSTASSEDASTEQARPKEIGLQSVAEIAEAKRKADKEKQTAAELERTRRKNRNPN